MKRFLATAAIAAALAATAPLSALADGHGANASTVLATVNGTEITLGHLIALEGQLPEQYRALPDEVLFGGLLDQLIQQQVLADAARENVSRRHELGLENEERAFLASSPSERYRAGAGHRRRAAGAV